LQKQGDVESLNECRWIEDAGEGKRMEGEGQRMKGEGIRKMMQLEEDDADETRKMQGMTTT
jgi:hypothetical protein